MSMRWRIFLSFMLVIVIAVGSLTIIAYLATSENVSTFVSTGGLFGLEKNVPLLADYYREHDTWEGAEKLLAPIPQGEGRIQGRQPNLHGKNRNFGLRLIDSEGYIVIDQTNPDAVGQFVGTDVEGAVQISIDNETFGYLIPEEGYVFPTVDFNESILPLLLPSSVTASLIAGSAGLVLAIILGFFLFRPIQELEQAAESMATGDLTQRVSESGPVETVTMGKAFNYMARELEKADRNRRNMTADIAHELRTPLAVQQANLEAMLDGVYPIDEANVQVLLDQNRTLRLLVEDLRILSLADAGELNLIMKEVEFNDFLATFLRKFTPRLASKELQMRTTIPEKKIVVTTDALRVEQILTNLLQNAVNQLEEKGSIWVALEDNKSEVLVTVRDSGEGIPEELLTGIFDRYSKGNAELRNKESTGLGLAISKRLAILLDGDLTVRNHPDGGAEFILHLSKKF